MCSTDANVLVMVLQDHPPEKQTLESGHNIMANMVCGYHVHMYNCMLAGPITFILGLVQTKPEPIMLLILPIILSRISHIFHPLFFIYSHAITYYSTIILQI